MQIRKTTEEMELICPLFHKDKNPRLPASAQTTVLKMHGGNEWPLKPAENVVNLYWQKKALWLAQHYSSSETAARRKPQSAKTTLMDSRSVLRGEALPPPIDETVLKLTVVTLSQILTVCPSHCYQVPYEQHKNPTGICPRQTADNVKQGRAKESSSCP